MAMKLDPALFISDEIHAREVELGDGKKYKFHFRELPNPEMLKFHFAESSQDDDVRSTARAKLVAASLCDSEGKPGLTFEAAVRLKPEVLAAFFLTVLEVNGFGAAEKKR